MHIVKIQIVFCWEQAHLNSVRLVNTWHMKQHNMRWCWKPSKLNSLLDAGKGGFDCETQNLTLSRASERTTVCNSNKLYKTWTVMMWAAPYSASSQMMTQCNSNSVNWRKVSSHDIMCNVLQSAVAVWPNFCCGFSHARKFIGIRKLLHQEG